MASSLFDLTGLRALVTGSGQGIGFAIAQGLAEHGAEIVVNGRNAEKIAKAVEALQSQGFSAHAAVFDVTDQPAVAAGVADIENDIGPIDILVNNAGMQFRAPLDEFPVDKWDELIRTNVSSVFYVGQAVAKRMITRKRGKIINIASATSELARPSITPYTASKGAVRNLTRGMCADWARHGIQINAIAPGYFKTPLNTDLSSDPVFSGWVDKRTPAGRWGELGELVGAAVFLAGSASSFVNGHTLYVDGGLTTTL